ncbi:MAG TPA: hypothetical protein VHQ24_03575 [Lachnospiraceae bacterium]|nr:hypothetical protein [Lachnospiraceae bacterium]
MKCKKMRDYIYYGAEFCTFYHKEDKYGTQRYFGYCSHSSLTLAVKLRKNVIL